MAHTHDVHDTGKRFEINGISRFIKETSATKLVLVQGDHKSEVVTFEMPRFIDGHDMLLCNKIRVHYINIDTKTSDSSADIYEVTDLKLCEDCGEEETLLFTWTIEAPATKYSGTLSFLVKFECTEGENVLYQWNTAKYVSVNVLAGIDNSEEFVEKYSNVLEEWYNELTKGADSIEELNQQAIAEIELAKEDAKEDIQGKADATMAEMNQFSSNAYNRFQSNVNKKASETLESIPEDYTQLSNDLSEIEKEFLDYTTYTNIGTNIAEPTEGITWGVMLSGKTYKKVTIVPEFDSTDKTKTYTVKRYNVKSNTDWELISVIGTYNIGEGFTVTNVTDKDYFTIESTVGVKYTSSKEVGNAEIDAYLVSKRTYNGYFAITSKNHKLVGVFIVLDDKTKLEKAIDDINEKFNQTVSSSEMSYVGNLKETGIVTDGYYINTSGQKQGLDNYSFIEIPVIGGKDIIVWGGIRYSSYILFGGVTEVDSNENLVKYNPSPKVELADGIYNGFGYMRITLQDNTDKIWLNYTGKAEVDVSETLIVTYDDEITELSEVRRIASIKNNPIYDIYAKKRIDELIKIVDNNYKVLNPLYGKKITAIGDSITEKNRTANKNWLMWLSEMTGCKYSNLGQSGTSFTGSGAYINRIPKIPSDTDIIGVAVSFNGIRAIQRGVLPLGDVTDTGSTTYCGYVNDFIDALLIAFPTTPIVFYTQSPWGDWHYGVELSDNILKSVSKICSLKGIPYYGDMYYKGSTLKPWLEENREHYYKHDGEGNDGETDTIHPNSNGHKVIATYLRTVFENNAL